MYTGAGVVDIALLSVRSAKPHRHSIDHGATYAVSPLQTVSLEGAPVSLVATVEQYLIQERARLRQQREAAEAAAQAAEAAAALGMARNRTAGQWENPAGWNDHPMCAAAALRLS